MGATRRSRLQHTFVIAQVMFTQPLLLVVATDHRNAVDRDHEAASAMEFRNTCCDSTSTWGPHRARSRRKRAAIDRLLLRIAETPGVVDRPAGAAHVANATLGVRA